MPRKAVSEAVDARLAAEWSLCRVEAFNKLYEPPVSEAGEPVPFLVAHYPLSETRRLLLSEPLDLETGVIRFILSTLRQSGVETALEWADVLADLFRHQEFDGVVTYDASSPSLDDDTDLGSYLRTIVLVEYEHQFTSAE
jgi:hypothetical protein